MDKFNSKFPNYDDDSDYNTNANSYYKDLGRKTELIKRLAKRIWEYDEELAKRFIEWDNNLEEFDDEVLKLLQEWLFDGTLEHMINHEILGNKAEQSELDKTNEQLIQTNYEATRKRQLEDLDEEILLAIQGGEGTSFDLLSKPQIKSVTPETTTFLKRNKNLFDGQYMKNMGVGGDSTSGYHVNAIEGRHLAVIPIQPNTEYTISREKNYESSTAIIGFIDKEPTASLPVSQPEFFGTNASKTKTAPENGQFLVVSIPSSEELPTRLQVEKGDVFTGFEPYNTVKVNQVLDPIQPEETSFVDYDNNLGDYGFDNISKYYNTDHDGQMMDGRGVVVTSEFTSPLTYTEKIPVQSNMVYRIKHRNIVMFNEIGQAIHFVDNTAHSEYDFETTDLTTHIVITVSKEDRPYQLKRRLPEKENRGLVIPRLITNNQRFKRKTIAHFGDSITANRPQLVDTISERLGNDFVNLGIGGAKMAERNDVPTTVGGGHTANSGVRIAESIVSGDFTAQYEYTNAQYSGETLTNMLNTLELLENTDFSKVDYATIQFGANDYLQGVPIGTIDGDRNTFMGAYRIFLETLLEVYPNIKPLVVSTPIIFNEPPKNIEIYEYVQATEEVAKHFNIPYLDNYTNAGINQINRYEFFGSTDGVHPISDGLIHLGNRIANAMNTNY